MNLWNFDSKRNLFSKLIGYSVTASIVVGVLIPDIAPTTTDLQIFVCVVLRSCGHVDILIMSIISVRAPNRVVIIVVLFNDGVSRCINRLVRYD